MKITAIIPAFNEHTQLRTTVLAAQRFVDSVIVVDDGSAVPLREALRGVAAITLLRHRLNLGKGAALKTGVVLAQQQGADIVVFLDADGQHNPAEIPQILAPLMADRADIVFGVRAFHEHMPFIPRFGNILLTQLLTMLFHIRVSDTQSGFRAFRMSVYPQLVWRSPRYAVETEMIVNAGKHQLRTQEVRISTIYLDKYKGTTIIDGVRILLNMITWKFL